MSDNPDVADMGVLNPYYHYLKYGQFESRRIKSSRFLKLWNVYKVFDEEYYKYHNKDVVSAGIDPFDHYRHNGWRERRHPCEDFLSKIPNRKITSVFIFRLLSKMGCWKWISSSSGKSFRM